MKRSVVNAGCVTLLAIGFMGCNSNDKSNTHSQEASMAIGVSSGTEMQISMSRDNILKGMDIYRTTCSPCHGSDGKGNGPAAAVFNPKPRDHTNGAYMDKLTNAHVFKVVRYGGQMFGYPTMPAQPGLSDEEIMQVVAYVRTLSNTYKPQ